MDKVVLNISPASALSLPEACALLIGQLPQEMITPEKMACISGDLSSPSAEINLKPGEYMTGSYPLVFARPTEVNGNGAKIVGAGAMGAIVMGSGVSLTDLHFDKHQIAVNILSRGGAEVRDVNITGCSFSNLSQSGIMIGATDSKGRIGGVVIDRCDFLGAEKAFDDDTGGSSMITIGAAFVPGEEEVSECVTENITVSNCVFHGLYRMGIQFFCGAGAGLISGRMPDCHDNEIRDIRITDNIFENSFDATINVIAGSMNQTRASCHDILIKGNRIRQGIWAIYLTACEPVMGICSEGRVYNVEICDNELSPVEHIGEITFGIAIQSGRIDYFDGTLSRDSIVENVKIHHNSFTNLNRGIFITGANILFDAPDNLVENCGAQNIDLYDNEFTDVDEAFVCVGAYHEGRRVDWNIGWPPHEKHWGDLLDDDAVTCNTKGNFVRNISVKNNRISGNRYRARVAGLYGFGQGTGTGNTAEDILFEGNVYTRSEGRLSVNDVCRDDRLHDGGGNRALGIIWKN